MNVLRRLFGDRDDEQHEEGIAGRVKTLNVSSSEVKRGDGVWESLSGLSAGAPSENAALSVSAVYASVNLISGAIASIPMKVYQRDDMGSQSEVYASPLLPVLNREFSPRWSAYSGWSFLQGSKLLHGDGFCEIKRGRNGSIRAFVPLHPSRVRPIATPDGERLIYEIQPDPTIERPDRQNSVIRVLDQDDMLHVPGFGFNGLRSLSPLRHALRKIGRLAINAQDFSSSFLENMARPDFALKTEKGLSDDQFKRLQEMLDQHRSAINSGKPMILEGGLDIQTLTMPLEDMQLLETRKFQVEEIARIYGIPPFLIGHMEKTTSFGSGVESIAAYFVRFALRDHLEAIEGEINRKVFRRGQTMAKFDTRELERADLKSLFEAFRVAIGRAGEPGWMTPEEARQFLNMSAEPLGTLNKPTPIAAPPEEAK